MKAEHSIVDDFMYGSNVAAAHVYIRMGMILIHFLNHFLPFHSILETFVNLFILHTYLLTGTLANSEDQDEMPHHAAFHQGLHFLQR